MKAPGLKRAVAWGGGALGVAAVCIYGGLVYSLLDDDPVMLISCMDVDPSFTAWTCKQVFRHVAGKPHVIADLNRRGGAQFPLSMKRLHDAEETLTFLLSHGLDVNAGDQEAKNLTALHGAASDANVERAKLLLKYGARVDVKDARGLTPLDVARRMKTRYPSQLARMEMIRLLESAESATPELPSR